jgi:drug/metabolite transporter (DMT)-like permease
MEGGGGVRRVLSGPGTGYLSVAIASLLWASSGTAGKGLFRAGITPLELVQVRVTVSCVLLLAVLLVYDRRLLIVRAKDVPYFALLGGAGMALLQIMYFYAISKLPVAAATLVQDVAPVLVAAFAMGFWGERATPRKILALALALGGCYLTVGGYSLALLHMNRLGIIGGLSAAVCFAGYTLLSERGLCRYPPSTVLFYAFLFASVSFHVFYSPFHYLRAGYSAAQWAVMLGISTLGTALPYGLYMVGVSRIRSTRAIITALLEPVAGGFLAFALLGEVLEPLQVAGGAMVIGAVALLQLEREHDEATPEFIRSSHAVADGDMQ